MNKASRALSIGLCELIFLIFLTLKLAEIGSVATWSWWWVTAPLWIPFGIVLVIILSLFITVGVLKLRNVLESRKKDNAIY